MYMRHTKKKSIKNKKRERKVRRTRRIKRRIRTRKNIGGSRQVYLSIQPSALGVRGDKEWNEKAWINNVRSQEVFSEDSVVKKPIVAKLLSKVYIDNEPSVDIDEKIAEIIGSINDSDKLAKPIYGKMLTSEIVVKATDAN
jgi:hypothetical protein